MKAVKLRLGDKVRDIVTGLEGIAVARVEYLNGCIQYCVQPPSAQDALKTDSLYIDQGQLRWIGHGINTPPKPKPKQATKPKRKSRPDFGGPSAHVPGGMGHP